jgi:hypothetical protein
MKDETLIRSCNRIKVLIKPKPAVSAESILAAVQNAA